MQKNEEAEKKSKEEKPNGWTKKGTFTFLAIVAVAAVFFLILLNIGLGLLIGSYLGNYAYGLLIMAGIYLLIIIIVFLARNSIKNAVANKIIHSLNS